MADCDSPDHPIIDRPHQYRIIRLDFHIDPEDYRNSFLDLVLRRDDVVRRLRFLGPQRLVVEEGFPGFTAGTVIRDIRHRQWDDLKVEVANIEASPGKVTFYAADVIDLDASSEGDVTRPPENE